MGIFRNPATVGKQCFGGKGMLGRDLEEDAEGSICSWRLVRSEQGLFAPGRWLQ